MWFHAAAKSLLRENGRTTGVVVDKDGEEIQVKAQVTVGTDGRYSVLRRLGEFELEYEDYHFDIIWFVIPKSPGYDNQVRAFLSPGRNYLIAPKYPESIQCGLIVPTGEYARLRKEGVASIQKLIFEGHSLLHPFAQSLKDFSPFSVLQVRLDLIKDWAQDGLLLVGDSAHTCSPAGAIGVAVACATAIVAADVLHACFADSDFSAGALHRVQELCEAEVRKIHRIQKAFSRTLLTESKFLRRLLPWILPGIAKLSLLPKIQRELVVLQTPLPISSDLHF
jgi:2-polyprenyl-6-methoxyphenol hydroxylase-like FAD-dependent oxidoreductase